MVLRKVIWNSIALQKLKETCDYIKNDSLQNARKVRNDVLDVTRSLCTYPERYPLDKYKTDNYGTYRAFEMHRLRIAYRVLSTEVKIIALRHTSMGPMDN